MEVTNEFVQRILKATDADGAVLWIAGHPSDAELLPDTRGVFLTAPLIPFSIEQNGRITAIDGLAARSVTLTLRVYDQSVIRISALLGGSTAELLSEMLQFDSSLKPTPLAKPEFKRDTIELRNLTGDTVATFRRRLPPVDEWSDLIPPPTPFLDATFYPQPECAVRLFGDDQFRPEMRDSVGLGFLEVDGQIVRSTLAFHAQPGEAFAGTGERFLEMNLSGRTLDLVNQDAAGVNSSRAYKNVPFYLSNAGYGMFAHTSCAMTISFAGVSTRSVIVGVEDEALDLFLIGDATPEAILRRYRQITGFPPELPLWSYGTWMSRMTYFSASEIEEIADRLRADHFPCDVIHIDTGWFEKDWVCEWRFSEERFPDPTGFMKNLRAQGFRVSLWQTPNLGADNCLIDEAVNGGFVPPPPAQAGASNSDFAAADLTGQIDFTNPAAVQWYQSLIRNLFDKGAAVIKTDFGEEIRDDVAYHGMDAARLRNLYGLLYQKAAFEQTERSTGEPIIWARAGWAGAQRYPLHWGGDAASTWDGLAGSLRGGLHLGLSGFAYWSHDVPGFHGVPDFMNTRPDPELYLRWTQFGVLSSHLRYHGTSPREPWFFPQVTNVVREWLKLRYALIPYLIRQASAVTNTGNPILRALLLHHPDDARCWDIDDQYYLGNDLMVAPFTAPGGCRSVYLPAGAWIDFFTGEKHDGPKLLHEQCWPNEHFPVFARYGASIPVYPEAIDSTDEMDLSRSIKLPIDASYHGLSQSVLGSFIDL